MNVETIDTAEKVAEIKKNLNAAIRRFVKNPTVAQREEATAALLAYQVAFLHHKYGIVLAMAPHQTGALDIPAMNPE